MKVGIERLQKFLLESKLLTEKQFEKSLQESKKSDSDVRDVLVSHGLISMEDLVKVEEAQLAILETYLPKMMEKGEVEKIAKAK